VSTAIGAVCGLVGMYVSYWAAVPSGTMIVLTGAAVFVTVLAFTGARGMRRTAGLDDHTDADELAPATAAPRR
jgi:manganese/iron transport system permease protein/iron/zinc/copper transport system permease protein